MIIKDVMTPCPYKVDAKLTLKQVLEKMTLHNVRHMPVIDNGTVIGLLSERDVKLGDTICQSSGYCPTAGEVCTGEPYLVIQSQDLSETAREMSEKKHDCALVVDTSGNLVGIFTTTDACRVLHMALEERPH